MKHRFWKNKLEQLNLQKGSLKLQGSIWRKEVLKIIRIWRHQKHSHKLKTTRSWRSSKAERLEALIFVKSCFKHAYHCRRNRNLKQRLIQRNLKSLNAYPWRTLEKDNSTIVQPPSPLLCFVTAIVQEQQLWLRWYSSIHGMDLKLFLHRIITKSINRSLVIWSSFKRLFLMWWHSTTYLVGTKGVSQATYWVLAITRY